MTDYGYEDDRDAPYFTLECSDCGARYDNTHAYCPVCESGNRSYDTEDAREWNSYAERKAR
jgi:hypothetical protein